MNAPSFNPSRYQAAIFDHIAAQRIGEPTGQTAHLSGGVILSGPDESQANAIIEAVAGSGKTTTIVQALELNNHS